MRGRAAALALAGRGGIPEFIVDWAESTGRSYDLTKWVVHRALRQMRSRQGIWMSAWL